MALYAAVGAELTQYDVNVESATLVKRSSVALPEMCSMRGPILRGGTSMSPGATEARPVPLVLHRVAAITG